MPLFFNNQMEAMPTRYGLYNGNFDIAQFYFIGIAII